MWLKACPHEYLYNNPAQDGQGRFVIKTGVIPARIFIFPVG